MYTESNLDLYRNRLLYNINTLLDVEIIDDCLYELKPKNYMNFTEDDNELADFSLNFDSKHKNDASKDTSESKNDSSYNFDAVYGGEEEHNLIKKLNIKPKKKIESRYK